MSLPLLASTTPTPTTNTTFPRVSSKAPRSFNPALISKRGSYTSCKRNQQEGDVVNVEGSVIDRRNVLLGLGGLYSATSAFGNIAVGAPVAPPDLSKFHGGAPVAPPDLSKCHLATDGQIPCMYKKVECCPPYGQEPIYDWQPPQDQCLRIRLPAHKLDSEYVAKFNAAIAEMKKLDENDPWNFMQQAQIHCAYCNGAYDQVGFPNTPLQVHGSFLFLPWHRYYLYFWEKILGKLIDDPTFAIPFWNWDTPLGMRWPQPYLDPSSSLYNQNRNTDHYHALLDLKYSHGDPNPSKFQEKEVILNNLNHIHKDVIHGLKFPCHFMGGPVVADKVQKNAPGSLERTHNTHHHWCGPTEAPNWDMGNFHTAARDTTFWGHHGNVDRLWYIFSNLRGNKVEFNDPNYLDASFIFCDENHKIVRCKVRDCLNPANLGYTYQPEDIPWLNIRRKYIKQKKAERRSAGEGVSLSPVSEFGTSPRLLVDTLRVLIERPKAARSKDEKEEAQEFILVNDIKVDHEKHARFDVYIAKPIEGLVTPDLGEFAGSFVHIPHSHSRSNMENVLRLGITNLVDDIEADSSEKLVVSFVPRLGEVTIGGASIQFVDVEED